MKPLAQLAGAFAAGVASWSAAEYGLHRFAMHELRGKGLASVEHLKHHADVTYFSPTSKKLLSAAGTTVVAWPAAAVATDRRRATAYTAGLLAMYAAYEVLHRRTHTHPPATAYGRRMRRSHLQHHFGSPLRNHGVTTTAWDRLFGTYDEPGRVVVPRRMAPPWLLDDHGRVRPELAADYEVRDGSGRRSTRPTTDGRSDLDPVALEQADQAEQDRLDAFANRPPGVDEAAPEAVAGA